MIICKFPSSRQQIFEKLRRVISLRTEISYDCELSLKDIELGLKSPMESFPSINPQSVAGREYACLGQKTEHFNLSTEQGFPLCAQNETDLFGTRM